MAELQILIPEATRNLIKNPAFRTNNSGWVPYWDQQATFEGNEFTPNPTGFDSVVGIGLEINNDAAIRDELGTWDELPSKPISMWIT
jgi:hypothetical protein